MSIPHSNYLGGYYRRQFIGWTQIHFPHLVKEYNAFRRGESLFIAKEMGIDNLACSSYCKFKSKYWRKKAKRSQKYSYSSIFPCLIFSATQFAHNVSVMQLPEVAVVNCFLMNPYLPSSPSSCGMFSLNWVWDMRYNRFYALTLTFTGGLSGRKKSLAQPNSTLNVSMCLLLVGCFFVWYCAVQ